MPLADLALNEQLIVRDCLRAAVEGPFFPDWEFHTLFGLTRDEVRDVLNSWPSLDESQESISVAINNSFANLLGYPHSLDDRWSQFISVPADELAKVYGKWKGHKP